MSFKTRHRTTHIVDVDGVEVELPVGPALDHLETHIQRVGDKLIIGYLVQDDDCQNPLKDSDCEGTLYTSDEGVITDDKGAVLRALGLTSLGSRFYPYERDLDHDGVFDLAKKLLRGCCCTPGGDDWEDFLAYCLDTFEKEDHQADTTFVEDVFDNHIDFGPYGDVLPGWLDARWTAMQEEAWDQLYEQGKIGDYLAVPVRYCDNNHGPGTTSIDTCSIDDANAVWVPDDGAIQNIEASCYPNGVSVEWNSGDTVGNPQLAVVTFNGVRVYASTRWDDAHKFVRKHYSEPGIFDLQKAAKKYAEGVLNEYQEWCNGNCFGYVVAVYTNVGTEEEPVWAMDEDYDSCWGFIGDEWAEEELARVVKCHVEKVEAS